MLAFDMQRNGQNISLELPLPIEILVGELRTININERLHQIHHSDFQLQPTSDLGEHFMKMLQPDDTLYSIAIASREIGILEGDSRQTLVDLIKADRLRDLDHMADYLQHGPAALDHFIRLKLSDKQLDLPAWTEELRDGLREAGFARQLKDISLREVDYTPLNEQGRQLLRELSSYESLATANLACTLLTVPDITASMREVADSARRLLPTQSMETMNFYCPLALQVEDDDGNLVEGDRDLLREHEDDIRFCLKEAVPPGDNVARYMNLCSQSLQDKVASAVWDVGKVGGEIYGVIRCELYAPLTASEKDELASWIAAQNHDGFGEGFEQTPIETTDGEIFVSFGSSDPDYFVYDQKKFEQHLNGDKPQIAPEQLTFYCPLTVELYDEECEDNVQVGNYYLAWYEDEIRTALHAEMEEDENMADYLDDGLKQKISSAEWDIAKIGDTVYGKITCDLREPLTAREQEKLADWILGQNSDGLGEGFEQRPVKTDDGDLYVSLWHSGNDYYVLPEDEFQVQVLEQTADSQSMSGMGGMA